MPAYPPVQPTVGYPPAMQPSVGQPAEPGLPPVGQPEPRVKLYYRQCDHTAWCYAGCFECIHDAEEYAEPLQRAGYQVHFRNCR